MKRITTRFNLPALAATLVLSPTLHAADLSPAETKAIAEQLTN
jgi:hypothetical protein